MSRIKAHQKYIHPATGKPVPGVTTIIDRHLAWKWPALSKWMVNQAKYELDPDAIRDKAANIGSLAHAMIEDYINTYLGKDTACVNYGEYPQEDIDLAENAFIAFLDWEKANDVEYLESEKQMVHSQERYGGTLDLIAKVNGKLTLVDFKTSTGVYEDHIIQVAAYQTLLYDEIDEVVPVIILHLSKSGRMTEHKFKPHELSVPWDVFKCCLMLDSLKGQMPK